MFDGQSSVLLNGHCLCCETFCMCSRPPPPLQKKLCASTYRGSKSMLFLTGQFLVSCLIIPPVLATINILYHLMMFCSFFKNISMRTYCSRKMSVLSMTASSVLRTVVNMAAKENRSTRLSMVLRYLQSVFF